MILESSVWDVRVEVEVDVDFYHNVNGGMTKKKRNTSLSPTMEAVHKRVVSNLLVKVV